MLSDNCVAGGQLEAQMTVVNEIVNVI